MALAIAIGLAGCAVEREPDHSIPADGPVVPAADTAPAAAVPADESASAAPTVQGAAWTAGDTSVERPQAGVAVLREVRTARHADYDRIVLDFGDDAIPSYRVAYVDRPVRQCGSGETVPLAGDAWLSIRLEPANAHTEEGEPTVRERERAPGLPALLELKLICDFEAHVEWVAGVAAPEPYRVFELRSPGRLVVDIRHRGVE